MPNSVRPGVSLLLFRLLLSLGLLFCSYSARADTGVIIYRVYLPAAGYEAVELPTLTFRYSDGRPDQTRAPCSRLQQLLSGNGQAHRCAWLLAVNPAILPVNVAFPDTSAYYWVSTFPLDPALSLEVKGTYPDARYMSLNLYDQSLSSYQVDGQWSALADYQIDADAGSLNPWQQTAAPSSATQSSATQQPAAPGGHFTVTAVATPDAGSSNTLPLPPLNHDDGPRTGLPPVCRKHCPPLRAFFRPADSGGLLPNVDNAYITALHDPMPGEVLVIRAKAPPVPDEVLDNHPHPWPPESGLRYWSICNNLYLRPYPVVYNRRWLRPAESGCLADSNIKLDAQGSYTVIVGHPMVDRSTLPDDMNWLSNSALLPRHRHKLILRHMLSFNVPQAIQQVTQDNDPASAHAIMQEYYPRITTCKLSTVRQQGWQACVPTS